MPTKTAHSPAEMLRTLEFKSKRIKQLATQLSHRIDRFETWLNDLPGKVEAELWVEPNSLEYSDYFGLLLHRAGKQWMVSYDRHREGDDPDEREWRPLREASVDAKLRAVNLFPKLLERIVEEQDALVRRLEAAQSDFDVFAAEIGAEPNEED